MADDVDEQAWLLDRRKQVAEYLANEQVKHGRIALKASWYVAPYVSLWEVGLLRAPRQIGWWAICGDHPTDYISATDLDEPREVLRAIGERWRDLSSFMRHGIPHPSMTVGSKESAKELGELLRSRAKLLIQWADDDGIWEDAS
jgi:hypothetical protein